MGTETFQSLLEVIQFILHTAKNNSLIVTHTEKTLHVYAIRIK
jgi:hypothetical protein